VPARIHDRRAIRHRARDGSSLPPAPPVAQLARFIEAHLNTARAMRAVTVIAVRPDYHRALPAYMTALKKQRT
jgi:hypothetical protein